MLHVNRGPYNIIGTLSCVGNINVVKDRSERLAPPGSDANACCKRLAVKGLSFLCRYFSDFQVL